VKRTAVGIVIFVAAFLIGNVLVPTTTVFEIRTVHVQATQPTEAQPEPVDETIETIEWDTAAANRESGRFHIRLLETGDGFHGDEIAARNGEKWLGLFNNGSHSSLNSTRVTIERVHDPIIDEVPTARTGKSVTVTGGRNPIFLINSSTLRPGRVETIFQGLTWEEAIADETVLSPDDKMSRLDKHFLQTYAMGGKQVILRVIKAQNTSGERLLALALESEGKRQILHATPTSYEGDRGIEEWLGQVGTLYWVGDLDADKKPDFYVDLFWHDNVSDKVLFLSSKAGKNELVKKVARFVTTGC
jgi:hypothetical protein